MSAPGSLGEKSLALLVATWGGAGINVVAGVLVARVLGPDALGSLAFGVGLSGVVLATLVPGFVQAHTKRVAEGQDVSRCVATLAAIKLALYSAVAVAAVVAGPWRHRLFETRALESVFLLLLAGALASNFAEVFTVALVARELAVARGAILLASRAVRLLATVAALAWAPDVRAVAAAFALEGVVELAGSAAVARVRLGVRLAAPSRESFRAYWSYARPLLLTVPVSMLQDSIDRVLVARWAGLAAAGYYHVARGLWEVLGSILAPPSTFLFTRLSALFAGRAPERMREARGLFASAVDKLLFVTAPAGLGLWFLAGPVVALLYGRHFLEAESAVRVFVLASLAAAVVNPHTHVVYALDAHARFVPVVLLRLVLYLALLALLVPSVPLLPGVPALGLGEVGGALGRVFVIVFPAWVYVRWTRVLAGIGFERQSLVYLAGFTIAVVLFHATAAVLAPLGAVATVAGGALGAAIYAAWLRILHPASPETFAYCLDLVRPARLAGLVRRAGRP